MSQTILNLLVHWPFEGINEAAFGDEDDGGPIIFTDQLHDQHVERDQHPESAALVYIPPRSLISAKSLFSVSLMPVVALAMLTICQSAAQTAFVMPSALLIDAAFGLMRGVLAIRGALNLRARQARPGRLVYANAPHDDGLHHYIELPSAPRNQVTLDALQQPLNKATASKGEDLTEKHYTDGRVFPDAKGVMTVALI